MSDDFYKTLGVSKTATQDEIKSAYKKMATKHHPDRNQDNKAAAESKMKEINEAYETLRDEQKRAAYDRYGKDGAQGGFGGGGSGFGGFGGGASGFGDLKIYLTISTKCSVAAEGVKSNPTHHNAVPTFGTP